MIEVSVIIWDDGTEIGRFHFEHLPREGEEIIVPWADDPVGIRCFDVHEVRHYADGVPPLDDGVASPATILRVTEIT